MLEQNSFSFKIVLFIATILVIVFMVIICQHVSAGLFGPDPTPTPIQEYIQDTWTPIDKCWVYQPGVWDSTGNYWVTEPRYVYSITYINQNGHREVRDVDIDAWYNYVIDRYPMYYQGSQSIVTT